MRDVTVRCLRPATRSSSARPSVRCGVIITAALVAGCQQSTPEDNDRPGCDTSANRPLQAPDACRVELEGHHYVMVGPSRFACYDVAE